MQNNVTGLGAVENIGNDNKKDSEILSLMRHRMKISVEAYSNTREDELQDLRFLAATPDNKWQWPQDVLATRGAVQGETIDARPTLTINKLPQHVNQVTNEMRQNRPAGKVIPVNDEADEEVAEIFDGMVRAIQYESDADVAYDTASFNQVTFGEGFIRILTDYVDDESFDQEIMIRRIRNSFSVYMDPMIQDPCGKDAEFVLISEDIDKKEYEQRYPGASPVTTLLDAGIGDQSLSNWITDNSVRLVEYFYIQRTPKTLNLYPNGQTAFEGTTEDKSLKKQFGKPAKSRKSEQKKVMWLKSNGYEILERGEWLGKYIPIARVLGNEFEIEGQLYLSGLVRNAKDAQRMYNYWSSQEAEMLALAPKAPFIGYGGQFEGYENKWKTANIRNYPYLEVNPDATGPGGAVLPLPQRAMPPMAQTGLIQAKMSAAEDIKATTGQYNASLGMESNERSGKAILARQREGDIGTFHYVDNLARAIRFVTRQLVDLIPKIYDTQRIARIIGEDGESKTVRIDPSQQEPVRKIYDGEGNVIDKIYNPSVGKYDVRVVTGPGYATKRQEALESMAQLLQGNPQLWAVAGDLFVKNMDWPGAQELARRFAKTIDPKLMQDGDDNPALMAAQQQIEQMFQMLQNVNQSMEARDLMIKSFEAQIKAYDAETKRISAIQTGMTPEQIQDIVMNTIVGAVDTGDIVTSDDISVPGEMMEPIDPGMGQMIEQPGQLMEDDTDALF